MGIVIIAISGTRRPFWACRARRRAAGPYHRTSMSLLRLSEMRLAEDSTDLDHNLLRYDPLFATL